mgnify:CR=1 FL=1
MLSLGAGVQSSRLLLGILEGEFGTPGEDAPSCAVFADTGWEPRPVYAWLAVLRERAEAAIDIPLQQSVFGNGEDYTGSFEALGTPDEAGETATDFYGGGRATFAEPPENVALIDVDEEAFRGVVGRTLLGFELRFVRGASPTRGCIRAHLFRYNVKRSDGRLVGAQRNLLVVLPPSTSLETGEWCRPSSGCL